MKLKYFFALSLSFQLAHSGCTEKANSAKEKKKVEVRVETPTETVKVDAAIEAEKTKTTVLQPLPDGKRYCFIEGDKAKIIDKGELNTVYLRHFDSPISQLLIFGGTTAVLAGAATLTPTLYKLSQLRNEWALAHRLRKMVEPFDSVEGTVEYLKKKGIDISSVDPDRKAQIQKILRSSAASGNTKRLQEIIAGVNIDGVFKWDKFDFKDKANLENVISEVASTSEKTFKGKKLLNQDFEVVRRAFDETESVNDAIKNLKKDGLSISKRGIKLYPVRNGIAIAAVVGGTIALIAKNNQDKNLRAKLMELTSGVPIEQLPADYSSFLEDLKTLKSVEDTNKECSQN